MLCDHILTFLPQSIWATHNCDRKSATQWLRGELGGQTAWVHMPALPLRTCVTFSKSLDLFTPQFPKL